MLNREQKDTIFNWYMALMLGLAAALTVLKLKG